MLSDLNCDVLSVILMTMLKPRRVGKAVAHVESFTQTANTVAVFSKVCIACRDAINRLHWNKVARLLPSQETFRSMCRATVVEHEYRYARMSYRAVVRSRMALSPDADPYTAPPFSAPWLCGNPFDTTQTDTMLPRWSYNGTPISKSKLMLGRRAEELEQCTHKQALALRVPQAALSTLIVRRDVWFKPAGTTHLQVPLRIYSMKAVKALARAAHERRVSMKRTRLQRLKSDAIYTAAAALGLDTNASRKTLLRGLHSLLTLHYPA